ncbi:hypothetical protein [Paenibacillus arenilitoris]|uniref:Uncharacterized protein n=1 Tax=Paenibacillus arenilitoris TaxID=2772299 RepID=A0A927CPV3_9BACL|nr:hypothetical protein [Paenibacillus arenilitoris]MBD2870892.1 hypothetical protein [Paenibacillus arenilitoris]
MNVNLEELEQYDPLSQMASHKSAFAPTRVVTKTSSNQEKALLNFSVSVKNISGTDIEEGKEDASFFVFWNDYALYENDMLSPRSRERESRSADENFEITQEIGTTVSDGPDRLRYVLMSGRAK